MWEDIRWLRQSVPISMSSSTVLQTRQKMLAATAQLQVRGQVSTQIPKEILEKLGQFSYQAHLERKRMGSFLFQISKHIKTSYAV